MAISIQLIFIGITFFIFSSALEVFPWYEPLTMGAFFLLIAITPVHFAISLMIWAIEDKHFNKNKCGKISFPLSAIHFAALFLTIFGGGSGNLFYIISVIGSLAVFLLGIFSIITIVKAVNKKI